MQHGAASEADTTTSTTGFADLLESLNYSDGEYVSLNYQPPNGVFASRVVPYRPGEMSAVVDGANCWFGVNPTRRRSADEGGRGGADDVTRLAAIWCDLDVKPGACRDLDHAHELIDELSAILGVRPSAVVLSGGGAQPYWPIDDGDLPDADARGEAAALLKRWGRLACNVADGLGARIDRGVYDLARVLRIPGSCNHKPEYGDPRPVIAYADTGAPITLGELRERLDEHGVAEMPGDRRKPAAVASMPDSWQYAEENCPYMQTVVRGWETEPITGGRHSWLTKNAVRVEAGRRHGCFTADGYERARRTVVYRFIAECDRTGREVPPQEIPNAWAWAVDWASRMSADELPTQIGSTGQPHSHVDIFKYAADRAAARSGLSVSGVSGVSGTLDTPSSAAYLHDNSKRTDSDSVRNDPGGGRTLTSEKDIPDIPDTDPLAGVVDGAWLDSMEFPPVQYAVPGFVSEGLGIVVGPPKAGKSWLVLALLLAVAAGGRALGCIPVDPRPVLYLALEDGHRRLQGRIRAVLGVGVPIPANLHVAIKATSEEAFAMIAAFLARHPDAMVVLDTLGKVKPPKRGGEDSYQVDYALGSRLKALADDAPGSALLVVHHSRKAESGDFVDAVSGTHGIAGAADFIAVLARKRHSTEAVLAITGRDIVEAEYALTAEAGRDGIVWVLDGDSLDAASARAEERREDAAAAGQMGSLKRQVLAVVNGTVQEVDTAAVAAAVGAGVETTGRYLRRLADDGLIVKASRGRYRQRLESCEVCGEPLTCGQPGQHEGCR